MLSEYFESANSFTYNGINSLDMGLFITGQSAADSAAEPEIETVEVPAKGILIQDNRIDTLDNQRFKDYEQKYTCCVDATQDRSLEELAHSIYMWLYAPGIEYSRLYDTYNTERYRLAYINSNASVSELAKRLLGEIEITFMCKAYERRLNGDKTITLTKAATIYNTGVKRVMQCAPEKVKGEDGLPIPPYRVYNIGNNSPENLLDFVDILQQELIRAGVLPEDYDFEAHKKLVPMQPGDVPVTYADTSALERDFGFKPSTSLREGLRRFAEWYKEFYL